MGSICGTVYVVCCWGWKHPNCVTSSITPDTVYKVSTTSGIFITAKFFDTLSVRLQTTKGSTPRGFDKSWIANIVYLGHCLHFSNDLTQNIQYEQRTALHKGANDLENMGLYGLRELAESRSMFQRSKRKTTVQHTVEALGDCRTLFLPMTLFHAVVPTQKMDPWDSVVPSKKIYCCQSLVIFRTKRRSHPNFGTILLCALYCCCCVVASFLCPACCGAPAITEQ